MSMCYIGGYLNLALLVILYMFGAGDDS